MVFQATGKTASKVTSGADFKDLELVKSAEDKSILDIQNAEKQAEKIIIDAERNFLAYENKSLNELSARLEEEYKREEQKAIEEAKKIKINGEAEAEQLKNQIQPKMPAAVDYIVKAIIGD